MHYPKDLWTLLRRDRTLYNKGGAPTQTLVCFGCGSYPGRTKGSHGCMARSSNLFSWVVRTPLGPRPFLMCLCVCRGSRHFGRRESAHKMSRLTCPTSSSLVTYAIPLFCLRTFCLCARLRSAV